MLTTLLRSAAALAVVTACVYAQKPVLTEDFESGKIDPAVWEVRAKGAPTMNVEETEGAHGKYALHIHYPDMERGAYTFIVATHLPDSVRTHYFGRAYMKISAVAQSHDPLIFTGEPGWPMSKFLEIGTSRGNWMPSYQENKSLAGQGRGEITDRSDTTPPLGKWFLLEWEFNDNPTSIKMWVDGEPMMTYMNTDKERKTPVDQVTFNWKDATSGLTGNGFAEWGFGMRAWQNPTPAMDVWYDDIAVSTSRIGK